MTDYSEKPIDIDHLKDQMHRLGLNNNGIPWQESAKPPCCNCCKCHCHNRYPQYVPPNPWMTPWIYPNGTPYRPMFVQDSTAKQPY